MVEIEFLDPGPEQFEAEPAPAADPAGLRQTVLLLGRALAPALLWAGAAALAILAPFHALDTISFRNQGQTQSESTDGWGRYRMTGDASALAHGPRYGTFLIGCAAVLAAAAALALVRALSRPVLPRVRTALGVAAAGGLAAFVAVLVLNFLSTKDTVQAQVDSFGSQTQGTLLGEVFTAHVQIGRGMWLAAAALACALLASAADLLAGDRPPVEDLSRFRDPAVVSDLPTDPQEDLLESGPPA